MIHVNVQGGTNAGRKTRRLPEPWAHICYDTTLKSMAFQGPKVLTSYSCPTCGTRRGEQDEAISRALDRVRRP